MSRLIYFFLILVAPVVPLLAYQQIRSYHEVSECLAKADKNTVVLFDVDSTLIVPGSKMLWPSVRVKHRDWINNTIADLFSKSAKSEGHLSSVWQEQEIPLLIEPHIVKVIADLQERGVKVFALTAILTGSYYSIPSLPEWRFNKLKQIGINFHREPLSDFIFTELPTWNGQQPHFYRGILCSGVVSKGEVTSAFLDRMGWKPSSVIFFDDSIERVLEVEEEMNERKIPVQCFHYLGAYHLEGDLDKDLALFQLNHLIEHEKWLMEEEAKALLNK